MRADIRCAVAVIGIGASVIAGTAVVDLPVPADVNLASASQTYAFPIASLLPTAGQTVGVAHPVVVNFRAPVTDRHAAERALGITSTPAMTGKYEWLDNKVVQWTPDRYWPARCTTATTSPLPSDPRTAFSRRIRANSLVCEEALTARSAPR